ncbi:MAG: hypothetical protein ABI700_10715 [Chloroflexota bacterium]
MRIPNSRLLRTALFGDAIFETVCGIAAITGSNALATSTDWNSPELFVIAGVLLLAVALLLLWVLSRPQVNYSLSQILAMLNLVFAVVGILLLIAYWSALTDGARWIIVVIALGVGIFGVLESLGLQGLRSVSVDGDREFLQS